MRARKWRLRVTVPPGGAGLGTEVPRCAGASTVSLEARAVLSSKFPLGSLWGVNLQAVRAVGSAGA